ncbi:MAG TPA: DegT/DnrJ/EryC1/StrS family aminotransferase [Solirubrobacteraceae bacterium]|nr:DegT/DnrJ/EryC1/StrS family aminotransferase [Solirubrobacteraceae bacterium]
MSWEIPLTDVAMPECDVEAVLECLRSGWLTMGPQTQAFEQAFAQYVGARHAVAVSSGTAALHLSLLAAGVGAGDEVIVPALTFVASAATVRYMGGEPVFADVVSASAPNIDVGAVERLITPRTKAVVAVHFMGYAADARALRGVCDEHGLVLIEDTAQAVGAHVEDGRSAGTIGQLGCFSFFSKKQLCVGEGGMVVCDDERLAARVRSLRSHAMTSVTWDRHRGHAESYDVVDVGFNYRMDEPRAALGLSRLGRLESDIAARRKRVRRYRELLAGVAGVELLWDEEAVERGSHFAFPVLLGNHEARELLRAKLTGEGIQTTWYPAVTQFTEYRGARGSAEVPHSEDVAARHFALPLWSGLGDRDLERVVSVLSEASAGERA